MSCCSRYESAIKTGFIEILPDSTINVSGCIHCFGISSIEFCPFCGHSLGPMALIQRETSEMISEMISRETNISSDKAEYLAWKITNASDTNIKALNRGSSSLSAESDSKEL